MNSTIKVRIALALHALLIFLQAKSYAMMHNRQEGVLVNKKFGSTMSCERFFHTENSRATEIYISIKIDHRFSVWTRSSVEVLGLNPGLLRLWRWQLVALATQIEIFNFIVIPLQFFGKLLFVKIHNKTVVNENLWMVVESKERTSILLTVVKFCIHFNGDYRLLLDTTISKISGMVWLSLLPI
jgi:hypothetical protein